MRYFQFMLLMVIVILLTGLSLAQPVQPGGNVYPVSSQFMTDTPYVPPINFPNGQPKVGDYVRVEYVSVSWFGGPRLWTETTPTEKPFQNSEVGFFVYIDQDHCTIATTIGTDGGKQAFEAMRCIPRLVVRQIMILDVKLPVTITPIPPVPLPGVLVPATTISK